MPMNARLFVIAVLLLSSIPCLSVEVTARLVARSPKPGPGELETPRVLAVQSATATCYVLDSGLERVVAITLDGQELKNWIAMSGRLNWSRWRVRETRAW